jgi:DNA-binding response OmpR family regulator
MDKQQVLLVYRSVEKSEPVSRRLEDIGLVCRNAQDPQQAADELSNGQYSAVVVHQEAAGGGLTEFCRNARSTDPNLLIIPVLTGHDETLDLELLKCGVDDVVTDLHHLDSLAKRVTIRLVSRAALDMNYDTVWIGEAHIDFINGHVQFAGQRAPLSVREAKLLKYLIANTGRTVSRLHMLHWVWRDAAVDPVGKNVDMYILRLRKLIEPDYKKPIYLKTVYGRGYKLEHSGPIV